MEKQYRNFDVQLRAEEGTPTKIVGYAAVFNSPSVDLGGFTEVILPGAFTAALADPDLDVIANVDHDNARPLGRSKSGTLRLIEDENGLLVEIDIPPTQLGADITALMARGDYNKMSFCFVPTEEQRSEDGTKVEILACALFDVSVVLMPAYPATDCLLREKPEPPQKPWRRLLAERRLKIQRNRHR